MICNASPQANSISATQPIMCKDVTSKRWHKRTASKLQTELMTSYWLGLPAPPISSQCTSSAESVLSFAARMWRPSNIWKPKQHLWERLRLRIQQVPFFLFLDILKSVFLMNPMEHKDKILHFYFVNHLFISCTHLFMSSGPPESAGAYPSFHSAKAGWHPGLIASSSQSEVLNKENASLIFIFCLKRMMESCRASTQTWPGALLTVPRKIERNKWHIRNLEHETHIWQNIRKRCNKKYKS